MNKDFAMKMKIEIKKSMNNKESKTKEARSPAHLSIKNIVHKVKQIALLQNESL